MDEVARTRMKRLAILIGTAAFFFVILVAFHDILVPFIIAVVLAYVLHPAVQWLHCRRFGKRRLPRWAAVLALYFVLFGVIGFFGTTMLPRLGAETTDLVRAVPGAIAYVRDEVIPSIETWVDERVGRLLHPLQVSVGSDEPDAGGEPDAGPQLDGSPEQGASTRPIETPRAVVPVPEPPRTRPRVALTKAKRPPTGARAGTEPIAGDAAPTPDTSPIAVDLDAGLADADPEAGAAASGPDAGDAGEADATVAVASGDGGAGSWDAATPIVVPAPPPPRIAEPEPPVEPPAPVEVAEVTQPDEGGPGERIRPHAPGQVVHDDAIVIRPIRGGGYTVELPRDGVIVEQIDDGRYRIGSPRRAAPQSTLNIRRQLDDVLERILEQSEQHAVSALRFTQRAVFITVEYVFNGILSLMLAAFILATTPKIMDFFRSLVPPRNRGDFDQLVTRIDRGLGGVIRGQLMICLINGVLSGIGFAIAGLRYWPVWTLLATVASLVPIFGTIVSSVPAIAVGLTQGWGTGLFVFIWIVGIHELEANVFNPKIMGDAAKMHPVIVVFALIAGAHTGGVLGALLGVPVASIIQSLFRFLRARAYDEEERETVVPSCDDPAEPQEAEIEEE